MIFIGGMFWFDVNLKFNALLTNLEKKFNSKSQVEMCFSTASNTSNHFGIIPLITAA